MLDKNMPIGVLDSGVGGLSVLKVLRRSLPAEDFIYLGDTARTPYGTRTEQEIRGFVEQMLCFFEQQGVKLVVIACNTLTVLGVDSLKKNHPFSLVGMSKGAESLLAASHKKKVGVFATPFTIGTGAHRAAILAADSAAQVVPVACPQFVPLIEGEQFEAPALTAAVKEYTDVIKEAGADALILSCTHYPFIADKITKALGPSVTVLDPAEETSAIAKSYLAKQQLLRLEQGVEGTTKVCFTADVARGQRLTHYMMPRTACSFALVDLK